MIKRKRTHKDVTDPKILEIWDEVIAEAKRLYPKYFEDWTLCPAVVLWGLNLRTADEIASACNVSQAAARIRADRMKELYRRDKFLTSPLERAVFENFRDYISNNRAWGRGT